MVRGGGGGGGGSRLGRSSCLAQSLPSGVMRSLSAFVNLGGPETSEWPARKNKRGRWRVRVSIGQACVCVWACACVCSRVAVGTRVDRRDALALPRALEVAASALALGTVARVARAHDLAGAVLVLQGDVAEADFPVLVLALR